MFKFYISKFLTQWSWKEDPWGMHNEWEQEKFCSQTRRGGEIPSSDVNMQRGNCFGFVLLCYVIG